AMVDRDVADAFQTTIADWNIDGQVDVLDGQADLVLEAFRVIQGAEIWRSLGGWIESTKPHFGDSIATRFAGTALIGEDEIAAMLPQRSAFRLRMKTLLPRGVGIVFPTTP